MNKRIFRVLGWRAVTLLVLVTIGFIGLKLFLWQSFSAPILYTMVSPCNSHHQAIFIQEGFQDRSWTLYVKEGDQKKPVRIASLDFDGTYMFNGAEWSKDGTVIVATVRLMGGNYDQIRAFGYDFSTGKAFVPEWNQWREYETNILSLVASHGGLSETFVSDHMMTTGAVNIWVWQIP